MRRVVDDPGDAGAECRACQHRERADRDIAAESGASALLLAARSGDGGYGAAEAQCVRGEWQRHFSAGAQGDRYGGRTSLLCGRDRARWVGPWAVVEISGVHSRVGGLPRCVGVRRTSQCLAMVLSDSGAAAVALKRCRRVFRWGRGRVVGLKRFRPYEDIMSFGSFFRKFFASLW